MKSKAAKKISASIVLIVLLSICLTVTSAALALSIVSLEENTFITGVVDINLNDEKPIFDLSGVEPGMTLESPFWLRNDSTTSVFYKIYCTDISGELAEAMDVKLYTVELNADGSEAGRTLIFQGKLSRLVKDNAPMSTAVLSIGGTQHFVMQLHFPEDCGNELQNTGLSFNLEAMAVQAKNNPNGEF